MAVMTKNVIIQIYQSLYYFISTLVISFDSSLGTSSGTSRVVTDRVRAATAAYAARLDRQERGLSKIDTQGSLFKEIQGILIILD